LGESMRLIFSQENLLMEPPQSIRITEAMADQLNAAPLVEYSKRIKDRFGKGFLVVQKVRPLPEPTLLYGVQASKEDYFFEHLQEKLLTLVKDKRSFTRHLIGNMTSVKNLMQDTKALRCLTVEFQVLVDVQGGIHHLDLDRCINPDGTLRHLTRQYKNVFARLDLFEKRFLDVMFEEQTAFELENLDLAHNVSCGMHNCLFPIRHLGHRYDGSFAYMVSQGTSNQTLQEEVASHAAWMLGESLRNNVSQNHFMLGPPHRINVSAAFASGLNAAPLVQFSKRGVEVERYQEGTVLVQKIRAPPSPALVYGSDPAKEAHFWDHLNQSLVAFVEDKDSFAQNLLGNMTTVVNLMEKSETLQCLLDDFKVLIDVHGGIHHFNLERCRNDGSPVRLHQRGASTMLRLEDFRAKVQDFFSPSLAPKKPNDSATTGS
jgi:hypothetical protein